VDMTETLMTTGAAATAIAAIIGVSIFLFRGIRAPDSTDSGTP